MYTYWYSKAELGQTFTRCASVGAAIDVALMDMASGQAEPERIERDDFTILDRGAIDTIYTRTWKREQTRSAPQEIAAKVVYDCRYSPHSIEWHISEAIRAERNALLVQSKEMREAYELVESLYASGDLSVDQASPIMKALRPK